MDMMVNPDCYRVTLMWGAQVGKTLTALCVQGYAIDMRPRSQMMMQPSQGDAQTWLETKFNPLVEASPGIARRIAKPRAREGVNNQRMKSYPGGFLMMAWSGSPKTMRGRSAPLIVCDEVDGYAKTPEGHPVSLLWQRSATFGDERFLFEISTPTIKGASYIETSFEDGDQRRFHVACPHCHMHQVMRWENVTWIGRASTCLAMHWKTTRTTTTSRKRRCMRASAAASRGTTVSVSPRSARPSRLARAGRQRSRSRATRPITCGKRIRRCASSVTSCATTWTS
ncbi:MAG TPA: phage terminase large subunit family protein [Xanthomonadaceae bacterium]|nr:phage terminase large subunit family protein [Xanthomonadaceae bacterium]